MQMITTRKNGFTLIELSVVLTVIGLIVGGVMSGQSLIHAARIRQIYTQSAEYIQAINTFRDKYDALPGDITNAQSFWGIADPDVTLCLDTDNGDKTTCNGDGSGRIGYLAVEKYEQWLAWKHLANDGLVNGKFTGTSNGWTDTAVPGVNVPRWRGKAGYTLCYYGAGGAWFPDVNDYGHILSFGLQNNVPTGVTNISIISAADAHAIDLKIDEGTPGNGSIRSKMSTWSVNCVSTDVASTAVYLDTNTEPKACALAFITGF